jgi:hypothetical protein
MRELDCDAPGITRRMCVGLAARSAGAWQSRWRVLIERSCRAPCRIPSGVVSDLAFGEHRLTIDASTDRVEVSGLPQCYVVTASD